LVGTLETPYNTAHVSKSEGGYQVGVLEDMKEVADLVKKFNDIDLNRRILKLENEVLELSRGKRRAEEKVEELQRTLNFQKELVFKKPFYYLGEAPELTVRDVGTPSARRFIYPGFGCLSSGTKCNVRRARIISIFIKGAGINRRRLNTPLL
jgi:hypothetical protein